MTPSEMITANNLLKRYGETAAVNGISFSISRGECYGFLGPNSAGKTTTIKIINCLSPLSTGDGIARMITRRACQKITSVI